MNMQTFQSSGSRVLKFGVVVSVLVSSCIMSIQACLGQQPVPESPSFHMHFQTIHTDGKNLLVLKQVPDVGRQVEQTYTVSVPFTENGVTRYRTEVKTRMVQPTKTALSPVDENVYFQDLSGKILNREDLVGIIPQHGRLVVAADPSLKEIPSAWKDILHANTIVMRTLPVPQEQR